MGLDHNKIFTLESGLEDFVFPHEDLEMPGVKSKEVEQFRVYEENENNLVYQTYYEINTKQTVDFVRSQHEKWNKLDHGKFTMWEVLDILTGICDESDPDTARAQQFHAFQTAEKCREMYPNDEWMHLVGLIHDCGKLMAHWGQPQFATVGDTFPVGCKVSRKHLFSKVWDEHNPDAKNPEYNTELGIYERHCGLSNALMSWGHDEYLYQVLRRNGCKIPEEGLYIIRFHSFYAHHQENDYTHLTNEFDKKMKDWLLKFQLCDLYSKTDEEEEEDFSKNVMKIRSYYEDLMEKYIGSGLLDW